MTYTILINVDGGCRNNGAANSIGAAAAVLTLRYSTRTWRQILPSRPRPTNQRAELTAIILGLEVALERCEKLDRNPWLDVTIKSDSKYAIGCITEWLDKWQDNGWLNARGVEVANRDLIERAAKLDERVREEGSLRYKWVPREDNEEADEECNDALDEEEGSGGSWY